MGGGRALASPAVRRWLGAIAGAAVLIAAVLGAWAAARSDDGYLWLNRAHLEAAVVDIDAAPAIRSLELGIEERDAGGRPVGDSYRFVNETVVTHYRAQAAPGAAQPVLFIGDLLGRLRVSPAAYGRLRRDLQVLSMARFTREPAGQISFERPEPGGTPWGEGLVYSPSGGPPSGANVHGVRRLSARWFAVQWG